MLIVFLCWNSNSRKLVQLFDWKWVNKQNSRGGSSFFGQIPSFWPPNWLFSANFHFGARASKFRFAQICAAFRLEMDQRAGLHKRFIVFRPNSTFSASEMSFFQKFSFRRLFYLCSFSVGNGSTSRAPLEVHNFLAKFHSFNLWKGIFQKFSVRYSFFLCSLWIRNGSTSRGLLEVHHFSANFHRFSLRNGIFSKIFVSVVILFCAGI